MSHEGLSRATSIQLDELYADAGAARRRLNEARADHGDAFDGGGEIAVFSAPGRTELGGNHTDHNNGMVLASAVQLDSLAAVSIVEGNTIRLRSRGFDEVFVVDLSNLGPRAEERHASSALIRGVAAGIADGGGRIGGFDATVVSQVLPGSGLSSSASFEVLVAAILNDLFNEGRFSSLELSKIAQTAENKYFGKPCGLMDQLACSTGGIVSIDFATPGAPRIQRMSYSFANRDIELVVVDTGGDHKDLTPEYAAVPAEMEAVAQFFGKTKMREVCLEEVMSSIPELRASVNDRAILRAIHYINENRRVDQMVAALAADDVDGYLDLVSASGDSSWELLQNCYVDSETQGITVALALTRQFLQDRGLQGACRVHGGGFAGTIQAYLPSQAVAEYTAFIEAIFGDGAVTPLSVRPVGAVRLYD